MIRKYRYITHSASGFPEATWTEIEEYTFVYCNLGWNGTGNGYYTPGIFSVSSSRTYDRDFSMIYYELSNLSHNVYNGNIK